MSTPTVEVNMTVIQFPTYPSLQVSQPSRYVRATATRNGVSSAYRRRTGGSTAPLSTKVATGF